ncbi:MAG: molybdate transporter molybdate-binding protein [Actinomycetota bacterium]
MAGALACTVAGGCSGPGSGGGEENGCETVTVLAASSFAPALRDTAVTPCAGTWRISSGSSTSLAAQVREGAPADVFVSAGRKAVESLVADGLTVGEPVALGSVRMALVTGTGVGLGSLEELPGFVQDGGTVGLCVASAPCGAAADTVLANATAVWGASFGRSSIAVTEAASAEDLVNKVTTGEVDAVLVYEYVCVAPTNAELAVRCVDIPDETSGAPLNVRTPYLAVRLREGVAADSFMAFISSAGFRAHLAANLRIS